MSGGDVTRRSYIHGRISKGEENDVDYLFGSISPRGGGNSLQNQKELQYDMESPDHTHRDTNESDNNISSCSTLDIINKIDHRTVQQLELQVRELSQRLQQIEKQRSELQHQLEESNAEKERSHHRLEMISAAHECRITEMHCVIAELSKKLRAKQDQIIVEEQEPEESEVSYQEGSVYNSELNLTNPDAECQTEPLDGVGAYSFGDGFEQSAENYCIDVDENELKMHGTVNKSQVEALQEEVLHLKAQIALLQSEISTSLRKEGDNEVSTEKQQCIEFLQDNFDANESNCALDKLRTITNYKDQTLNDLNQSTQNEYITSSDRQEVTITSPHTRVPNVPKMAERVKLRCASKFDVTAMDLLNSELKNADLVEHLVSDLKRNNSMLESFAEPSQFDNELQRLQRKVENLKVRNTLLSLTLDESKEHSEHLYLLCGKYESNAVALQSAVNCSDRAIEAYDVMLALLESKLALIYDKTVAAEESRKAVESVARHLLDRLESEKNICENSLGPWQNSFSMPDKPTREPWTSDDDNRIRYHVSKLKGRRALVQNTIVNLESPFSDLYEKRRLALEKENHSFRCNPEKNAQLDIEMAVLMQELLNLREENIQLKLKSDDADRERQYANDRISILHDALKQLQLQLQLSSECSNALFNQQHKHEHHENRISYSEAEHAAVTEQQLVEALTRESELKGRIQTLIASVTATQKISDEKYEQLHNNVRELQKSNVNIGQMLEQNKRKYQFRISKLEQKIVELKLVVGRHTDLSQIENVKYQSDVNPSSIHNDNVPETTL